MPSTLNAGNAPPAACWRPLFPSCVRAAVPRRNAATPRRTSCSSPSTRCAPTRSARTATHRLDPVDGSAGGRRRPLLAGARLDGRHAAVARQHPLGPVSVPPRRARERRVPLSRGGRDAGHAAEGARLSHGGVRQRVSPRRAVRLDARVRHLRRPLSEGREPTSRFACRSGVARDTVAAALEWIGHGEASAPRRRPPVVCLGPSVRAAFPVSCRRSRSRRDTGTRPILAKCRRPMRRSAPLLQPILDGPAGRDTLVVFTVGPRRVARRARRDDARPVCLRRDAAGAARSSISRACSSRGRSTLRSGTSTSCRRCSTRWASPVPAALDGRTLLPLASGGAGAPSATYFESLSASLNRGWAPLYGVSRGLAEVHRSADSGALRPGGRSGRIAEPRRRRGRPRCASCSSCWRPCARTTAALRRHARRADTREQLRSLGYLSGTASPKDHYTEADDPKRLIELDRQIDEVVSRYQQGDLRGAIALGEGIVQRRPDMPLSLVHLAFLYNEAGDHRQRRGGDPPRARAEPRRRGCRGAGRAPISPRPAWPEEAVRRLAPYVRAPQPDVDVLIAYGVALASVGREPRSARGVHAGAHARSDERPAARRCRHGVPDERRSRARRRRRSPTRCVSIRRSRVPTTGSASSPPSGRTPVRRSNTGSAPSTSIRAISGHCSISAICWSQLGRPSEARPYWERYLATAPPGLEASDRARVRHWLVQATVDTGRIKFAENPAR